MKEKVYIFIITILLAILIMPKFLPFDGSYEKYEDWSSGYDACMNHVINSLMKCEGVRLGSLIINEPNTFVDVSNTVFFAVDPNRFGVEIDANDVTLSGKNGSCELIMY